MSIMNVIGEWHEKLYDRAFNREEGESNVAHYARCFLAGAVDGWNTYCLILGNFICAIGVVLLIMGKKKED